MYPLVGPGGRKSRVHRRSTLSPRSCNTAWRSADMVASSYGGRTTRMPQRPECVHCFLADRCILPLKRCHGFCHGALQLGHTRATALRELGLATTAPAKLLTHGLEQSIGFHW